jgi:hypothetical protein
MRILCAFLVLLAASAAGATDDSAETSAATAIAVSEPVFYSDEGGELKAIALGQLFTEGDHLVTRAGGSLHLVLPDGSSLVLGPETEVTLTKLNKAPSGQRESIFDLLKGAVNAIVEKLTPGSSFEVHTAEAVAAVKGTDFEVSTDGAESSVTVQEGEVSMMDPLRRRAEAVGPLTRGLAHKGSLGHAFALPKREASEFQERWQRAHMIHEGRMELMKHFMKERKKGVKAMQARKQRRSGLGLDQRRKNARERFKKKREEMKKERQEKD